MQPEVIVCVGGKAGLGKSTLARSIAVFLASNGFRTVLGDLHPTQQTSVLWARRRLDAGIQPLVAVEPVLRGKDLLYLHCDVVVADGALPQAATSISAAELADLVIIPVTVNLDDIAPQEAFARTLIRCGIERSRILFVLNFRPNDLDLLDQMRMRLGKVGRVAATAMPFSIQLAKAHSLGHALGEVPGSECYVANLMEEISLIMRGISGARSKAGGRSICALT